MDDQSYYYQNMMVSFQETEWCRMMYVAFNGQKGELKREGNQWCATSGEWPVHNITGFANSPALAMQEWWNEYNKKIS